jgi:hypothetical protein
MIADVIGQKHSRIVMRTAGLKLKGPQQPDQRAQTGSGVAFECAVECFTRFMHRIVDQSEAGELLVEF